MSEGIQPQAVLLIIALATVLFLGRSFIRKKSESTPTTAVVRPIHQRRFLHSPSISRQEVRKMYTLVLPQDTWEAFEAFVHQTHPDLFLSFRKKLPSLTQAERQLCGLIYFGRSTREMTHLLQERPERVKLARTRLRRKLKIADQLSLYQGLQMILFKDSILSQKPGRLAA
ncbi:MAG: hypothetical protein AAF587_32750 [Bacteroidota bacterium]